MRNLGVGLLVLLIFGSIVVMRQTPGTTARPAGFDFLLRYGVEMSHANLLDTAIGRYTKDTEAGLATTDLKLTDREMAQVQKKLSEIDFWNEKKYPAVFVSNDCGVDPSKSMVLKVTEGSRTRELSWANLGQETLCPNSTSPAGELRALLLTIRQMIEAKPEFRRLPAAQGYR